ncbi:MAG: prephenate dehydrogenase [Bacteroidetes bacterium]|nr:prephenate dehydrogenase [Bacteroidota bacterium]
MKITVIGLGLIGGSMALDLKTRGFCTHVIGVDNNAEHCKQALKLGIAGEIKSLNESLQSDVVILSIPVTETANLLPHILNHIGENTVVMDVGSTKQEICKAIKKHPKRGQFVATHPIAGTEYSGPTAAIKNLFDNKVCILCADDSALWVVERVSELYETLNMKLLFMKPEEHDMHVAYVSHISHISSFALATTVLEMEKNASTIFNLAGSGFASTVRLAKSSPDMWAPIFEQNSKYVSKALGTYIKHLEKFKNHIDKKNTKATHEIMEKANVIRKVLDKK